jgi:3-methyladenine DNA glycosylase AlkD
VLAPERLIGELQPELERRADPDKKAWWESFVKGAAFRGTPMREIRGAVVEWLGARPDLSPAQRKRLAIELMRQPLSEDKLAGMLVLSEHTIDELGLDDLPAFRALFAQGHLADWGVCDWFCVKVLGRMLERCPERERIADELIEWTRSDNLWMRRAGIVGFVKLAPRGNPALPGLTARVLAGAARNAADSRRFAQTSVGWVLRELSSAEPEAVRRFLVERATSSLPRRVARRGRSCDG